MNIIAVVVTHNRLELLKRNIRCLRQNKPLSSIIVVDNGCTDGTSAWLDRQDSLTVVHQANTGGAGGFHTGMQRAFLLGADWVWCMDDDVFPRPDCLERLLAEAGRKDAGILSPRRLVEGKVFTNDFREYNLTNPFASMYAGKLSRQAVNAPVEVKGTAFEGPLIRREVIAKAGLPNKELFIFCDDTDYCLRAVQAGFRIYHVPSALMDKEKFFRDDSWSGRNRKKKWKRFYQVRNSTYLNHRYGRNTAVRYLRSFIGVAGYMLTAFFTCPFTDAWQWGDIARLWKAYLDGLHERLGIMSQPTSKNQDRKP